MRRQASAGVKCGTGPSGVSRRRLQGITPCRERLGWPESSQFILATTRLDRYNYVTRSPDLRRSKTSRLQNRRVGFAGACCCASCWYGTMLRGCRLGEAPLWTDEAETAINALTILAEGVPTHQYLGQPIYENTLTEPWPEHPEDPSSRTRATPAVVWRYTTAGCRSTPLRSASGCTGSRPTWHLHRCPSSVPSSTCSAGRPQPERPALSSG